MSKLLDYLSSDSAHCKMKENREHFGDELFIDAPHGIVIHRDFEILFVDDNYAKLFGFESAEALMAIDSLLDLIDPAEWTRSIKTYQQVMSGEKPPTVHSSKNLNCHREEMTVLVVDHVIDWEGAPAMQVTIVDLSQQVKAQRKLKDSEKRYRALIDGSIQGILVHQDFVPLYANRSFLEMFALEDLSGIANILPYIDPKNERESVDKYHQLISGERNCVKSEYKIRPSQDDVMWVHVMSTPCDWEGRQAVLATVVDVTEQRKLREALEYKANHDNLTGLMNRHYMSDVLQQKFAKARNHGIKMGCILADIDNFKVINDTYGHLSGDKVLKIFSDRCKSSLLHDAEIGRWGGEEFIFLFFDADEAQILSAAEQLRAAIANQPISVSGDQVQAGFFSSNSQSARSGCNFSRTWP